MVKKKMFYNMKIKTIRRNLADMQSRLSQDCGRLLRGPEDRIRTLVFAGKEVKKLRIESFAFSSHGNSRIYGGKGKILMFHL